ncbi:MAG TPA: hypothetical protein VG370_00450 [Chloroflexota bacterium]|jgi:hypothetical protein|nr:hypothetical protein [Chloroflexota bacterium]
MGRAEVLQLLGHALLRGDRETARAIYYRHVIPNQAFSHREADRMAYRVGAIDEGDRYLASHPDL